MLLYFESVTLYFEKIFLYFESILLYFESAFLDVESISLYFSSIVLYFATMVGKEKVVIMSYFTNANLLAVGDTTYVCFLIQTTYINEFHQFW